MHIFHIAEAARWEAARLSGSYAQSTLGRTLDEEGFLHAARDDQWQDVRRRYYAGVTEPLVLLVIDTEKLTSPLQEDVVGDTTYPHIYGPLNPSAVVTAVPLDQPDRQAAVPPAPGVPAPADPVAARVPQPTFFQLFLGEMAFRMFAAVGVMVLALLCALLGGATAGDVGGLVGLLLGLAVGVVGAVVLSRRRDARPGPAH